MGTETVSEERVSFWCAFLLFLSENLYDTKGTLRKCYFFDNLWKIRIGPRSISKRHYRAEKDRKVTKILDKIKNPEKSSPLKDFLPESSL